MEILKILENTSAIIILALLFGLIFDFSIFRDYLSIFLIIAMCFSLVNFQFDFKISRDVKRAINLLFVNYVLLSLFILIPSFLLLEERDYLIGFIILCALPPAVIAIPYTHVFRGDKKSSLLAEILGYLIAIILIPFVFYLLFRESVDVIYILFQLVLFIILPMIISRFLIHLKKIYKVDKFHENKIVNISIFLLNATILSTNKQSILSLVRFHPIWIILIIRLLVPFIVHFIYEKKKVEDNYVVSTTIFSSVKNNTLGMVIVLNSFYPSVAIPLILSNILGVVNPLIFGFLFRR